MKSILHIRLHADLKEKVSAAAKEINAPESEIIRAALIDYFKFYNSDCSTINVASSGTKKISISLPDSIEAAARESAKHNGMTLSRYITNLLQANVTSFPVLHKDEIEKLDECRDELRRIGNNVNQLSKHFNTTLNDFNPKGYKEFRALYKEIINLKSAISDLVKASKGGIWNGRN